MWSGRLIKVKMFLKIESMVRRLILMVIAAVTYLFGVQQTKHVGAFIYLIKITKCLRWISLFSIL